MTVGTAKRAHKGGLGRLPNAQDVADGRRGQRGGSGWYRIALLEYNSKYYFKVLRVPILRSVGWS